MSPESVPISGNCWGSVLGALGEVCWSLLRWSGVASAPWCKSQLCEAPLGVGRKEQLVLVGGSKALLSRCFDPGTERWKREEKQGGEVGTPWLGREQLHPLPLELHLSSWCWESTQGALHGQEPFAFILGRALVFSDFPCPLSGWYSEEIQIAHRFFFSLWKGQDLSRSNHWSQGTCFKCYPWHEIFSHFTTDLIFLAAQWNLMQSDFKAMVL